MARRHHLHHDLSLKGLGHRLFLSALPTLFNLTYDELLHFQANPYLSTSYKTYPNLPVLSYILYDCNFQFGLNISSVFCFDMLVSETGLPFMAQAGLEPLIRPL